MKSSKKPYDILDQSNNRVRKSKKHDANLEKNSSLYFQIGLVLCLLGTYALFEMQFEIKAIDNSFVAVLLPEDNTFDPKSYVPEQKVLNHQPQKQMRKQIITNKFDITDDNDKLEPIDIFKEPQPTSKIIDPNTLGDPLEPVEKIPEIFDISKVEVVPIYPGCEMKMNNEERIKCMSEKLTQLIQRKFNTDLAETLGLTGIQRINLQFKIDKSGEITDILTRAPHPELEREAERLAKKIPSMMPGMQRHQPVSVLYNLPIVFKVQD